MSYSKHIKHENWCIYFKPNSFQRGLVPGLQTQVLTAFLVHVFISGTHLYAQHSLLLIKVWRHFLFSAASGLTFHPDFCTTIIRSKKFFTLTMPLIFPAIWVSSCSLSIYALSALCVSFCYLSLFLFSPCSSTWGLQNWCDVGSSLCFEHGTAPIT